MARKCYATGKGTAYGNSLSHLYVLLAVLGK